MAVCVDARWLDDTGSGNILRGANWLRIGFCGDSDECYVSITTYKLCMSHLLRTSHCLVLGSSVT